MSGRNFKRSTLALGEFEWDAEPTDGSNLTTGETWWGVAVKYRRIGTRPWHRFYVVDVHSWQDNLIHKAITEHVRMNGTRR
jgi:hypothetical protein